MAETEKTSHLPLPFTTVVSNECDLRILKPESILIRFGNMRNGTYYL